MRTPYKICNCVPFVWLHKTLNSHFPQILRSLNQSVFLIHAIIEYTSSINTSQPAANIYDTYFLSFHLFPFRLFSLFCFSGFRIYNVPGTSYPSVKSSIMDSSVISSIVF